MAPESTTVSGVFLRHENAGFVGPHCWGIPHLRCFVRRFLSPLLDDNHFLQLLGRFERVLARVLAVCLGIVIVVASVDFILHMGQAVVAPQRDMFGVSLVALLGELLTLLIAIEVLQNITAYLRQHTIQLELVLATALTALARKIIVLKPDGPDATPMLAALGAAVLCLSAGYLMVRYAHHQARNESGGN